MEKLLDNKLLNIIQVAIYWVVILVYLLAIKIELFDKISFTVLVIGAILSLLIMLVRFIFSDKIDGKTQKPVK